MGCVGPGEGVLSCLDLRLEQSVQRSLYWRKRRGNTPCELELAVLTSSADCLGPRDAAWAYDMAGNEGQRWVKLRRGPLVPLQDYVDVDENARSNQLIEQ